MNSHILSKTPDNLQIPLHRGTKTGHWYVAVATNTETQKQDTDEKQFAEIVEKTRQATKQINSQMNQSVQNVEKETWQEVTTVKSK